MKRFISTLLALAITSAGLLCHAKEPPRYGSNPEVGKTAEINGIELYYETYGDGKPLLLIHPNSGNISAMAPQIGSYAEHFKVIAPDSRGHGRSGLGEERLTYTRMADDLNQLLEQLDVKSAHVVGWSDGGIIGLLLAIHHPDKVDKLAIMGANLNPAGAHDWALEWVARQVTAVEARIAAGDPSPQLLAVQQHMDLLGKQPDIKEAELKKIKAPVLVMAGDRDVIRNEHTLVIFDNIPKAQLEIFPGATHMIPAQEPDRFNRSVLDFLLKPFQRPDTKDMFR
jgi:pimeloyl-ACP methyl ester carboxylesterase